LSALAGRLGESTTDRQRRAWLLVAFAAGLGLGAWRGAEQGSLALAAAILVGGAQQALP
jgi:hypothetical protein